MAGEDESNLDVVKRGMQQIAAAIEQNVPCMVLAVVGTSTVGKSFLQNWVRVHAVGVAGEALEATATKKVRFQQLQYELSPTESITVFYFDMPGELLTDSLNSLAFEMRKAPEARAKTRSGGISIDLDQYNAVLSILMLSDAYLLAVPSNILSRPDDHWGHVAERGEDMGSDTENATQEDRVFDPWPGNHSDGLAAWRSYIHPTNHPGVSQFRDGLELLPNYLQPKSDSQRIVATEVNGFARAAINFISDLSDVYSANSPGEMIDILENQWDHEPYTSAAALPPVAHGRSVFRPLVLGFTKFDRILLGRLAADPEITLPTSIPTLINDELKTPFSKAEHLYSGNLNAALGVIAEARHRFGMLSIVPIASCLPVVTMVGNEPRLEWPQPGAGTGGFGADEALKWLSLQVVAVRNTVETERKRRADEQALRLQLQNLKAEQTRDQAVALAIGEKVEAAKQKRNGLISGLAVEPKPHWKAPGPPIIAGLVGGAMRLTRYVLATGFRASSAEVA